MKRRGQIHVAWLAFLASVVLLAVLVLLLVINPSDRDAYLSGNNQPLTIYCAAAVKVPVEEISKQWEGEDFGTRVRLQYGSSASLLANIEVAQRGDLFIPADESDLLVAKEKGLVREIIPLATMRPILIVAKGNPLGLHSIADLTTGKARVAQGNESTAIGRVTQPAIDASGQADAFRRIAKYHGTVSNVGTAVETGAADAGLIWDANVGQFQNVEAVELEELRGYTAQVAAGVLASSSDPTAALRFARYLAAKDRGLPVFEKAGFRVVAGDAWDESPSLKLFAGAMLRPAIDDTIREFEKREGVRVERIYDGCGTLVSTMRTGVNPDAFFACDKQFMNQVSDLYLDASDISTNQLVIVVPKGNPLGIARLEDLAKPGIRLGIGNEQKCAMGVVTQTTLRESKLKDPVMKNVKVQSPTGDALVNQLLTGSLDAAIAYVSNAAAEPEKLDAIVIDIQCATVVQPMAVGRKTQYPHTGQRLMEALQTAESRGRFLDWGFKWLADGNADSANDKTKTAEAEN